MNTEKVVVSREVMDRIGRLHDSKLAINEKKIKRHGSIDIDDHGFIDFEEFAFEPECAADGKVHGCALIGRNLRRLDRKSVV